MGEKHSAYRGALGGIRPYATIRLATATAEFPATLFHGGDETVQYASLFLLLTLATCSPLSAAEPFRMSLNDEKIGELPKGWGAAKTGSGPGSVWKVVDDATAAGGRALAQVSAEGPNPLFNLCVFQNARFSDVDIELALKAIAGTKDQGGGPVWRYKDANNYYVARVNPLEDNYRVYRVIDGNRIQLRSADVKAPAGQWHRLRVVHKGDRIQCYLNGKLYLSVQDDAIRDAGQIGLWTKADAQTHFADAQAREQ